MNQTVRKGIATGAIFGAINIFLILIGFTAIISMLLGDFLGFEVKRGATGNIPGLLAFFGLLGLWAGARGARRGDSETFGQAMLGGATTGLTGGLILAVFALVLGWLQRSGANMRSYMVQLSPVNTNLILLEREPLTTALIYLGLVALSGLAGALLACALGQFSLGRQLAAWRILATTRTADLPVVKRMRGTLLGRYAPFLVLALLLLVLPRSLGQYWNFTLGTVGIYVLMGLGLNIVVGMAGLLDLGYVAFFAVGAYTIGLLTSPGLNAITWGFWTVLPISILVAAIAGILLGLPVLRLRGDYLAIVTLGFGEIIRILVKSDMLSKTFGGPQGVRDIAGPTLLGQSFSSERDFMYLIVLAILLIVFVTMRLQNSRVGRAWEAMREDETVAQAMGINTYRAKLLAFAIGAAFAGLGGALFAARNQYTGPEDHALLVSINVLSLVIVGGMGSIPGVVVGAFVLKGLPEILRQVQDYRILAFGALLVVMMILRPEGLWPSSRRRLELRGDLAEAPPEEVQTADAVPAASAAASGQISGERREP